jgi:hypothetical protein
MTNSDPTPSVFRFEPYQADHYVCVLLIGGLEHPFQFLQAIARQGFSAAAVNLFNGSR